MSVLQDVRIHSAVVSASLTIMCAQRFYSLSRKICIRPRQLFMLALQTIPFENEFHFCTGCIIVITYVKALCSLCCILHTMSF